MMRVMRLFEPLVLVFLCTAFAAGQTATAPSAGDGTSGDPYQIATLENLYWLTQNSTEWDMHFIQTSDIDASSSAGWASDSGFSPIGNGSMSFTGSYNGAGYTIADVQILRSSVTYVGLFGFISDATIKNVKLEADTISGNSVVGGLVGFSTGSGSAQIENCSVSGVVIGAANQLGGLIGKTQAGTTVRYCFANVNVSTTNGNYVGGFIGHNDQSSTISDCYSKGNVSGYNQVGGFAGVNQSSTISNCYSTGSAAGNSSVGGFVGAVASSTINNSFWDTDASGNATSNGGTGKTTTQMKSYSTFADAGWDFVLEETNGTNDYWDMDTTNQTVNGGYPFLAWENGATDALPVQMTGLVAEVGEGTIRLQWTTTTEVDNAGWEIEKSSRQSTVVSSQTEANGWAKIGFVEGAGTSTFQRTYTFTDPNPFSIFHLPSSINSYRLRQMDRSGGFSYSEVVTVDPNAAPKVFFLSQNYPNPFNPSTVIGFSTSQEGRASLKIFTILGQEVATLYDAIAQAGVHHSVKFDASHLAAGLYLARLESGGVHIVRKLALTK